MRLPDAAGADFVLEFDDDAFGGFFADAGNLGKHFDVAAGDRAAKGGDVDAAEDVEGGFGADAADGVDEQAEKLAFGGGHEAVKDMGVLADHKVSQELYRLAGRGQLVEEERGMSAS